MWPWRSPLAVVLGVALAGPAGAAQTHEQAASPCSGPEHRVFDFWIGDWDVFYPDGRLAGRNRIEPVLGGCALRESWQGSFAGSSLSALDSETGRWHQTWVDETGLLLRLDGGLENGAMVLRGTGPTWDREGLFAQDITWSPKGANAVQQTGRLSEDGGSTWTVTFDLTYRRRAPTDPAAAPSAP